MLVALTRSVSPKIGDCELTYLERQPIDPGRAARQHSAYVEALRALGVRVVELQPRPDLPDGVFVEDTAVVLDEVAAVARPGAVSRRAEIDSVAAALRAYRPLRFLAEPATLDGGDVFRAGRTLYAGLSSRTNAAGVEQLRSFVEPFGYQVQPVPVVGCLHLKSACTYLGANSFLLNRDWIDCTPLSGADLVDVAPGEPFAADTLVIGDVVLMPAAFPRTRALLERRGFRVKALELDELEKAEAGVSCMSIVFEA